MIVITSIFVAEARSTEPHDLDLPVAERRNVEEDVARELVSLYEGKNRVLPME